MEYSTGMSATNSGDPHTPKYPNPVWGDGNWRGAPVQAPGSVAPVQGLLPYWLDIPEFASLHSGL